MQIGLPVQMARKQRQLKMQNDKTEVEDPGWIEELTTLTGTDVQYSSYGAILGDHSVFAVTLVVWVDRRGGQCVWQQGVAVHFNPQQIQVLHKTCWHRSEDKTTQR